RFTQATASSMSLTSQSQKPATSSLVSANGPSMTVRPGPSNAIRLPCEEGLRPWAASLMPALTNSSLYLCIASHISVVGRMPFSLSPVGFTSTITRMVCLLVLAGLFGQVSERRRGFAEIDIVLQISLDGTASPREAYSYRGV